MNLGWFLKIKTLTEHLLNDQSRIFPGVDIKLSEDENAIIIPRTGEDPGLLLTLVHFLFCLSQVKLGYLLFATENILIDEERKLALKNYPVASTFEPL